MRWIRTALQTPVRSFVSRSDQDLDQLAAETQRLARELTSVAGKLRLQANDPEREGEPRDG